jgi:uncharacterized coiled-coil DUF342 family protein
MSDIQTQNPPADGAVNLLSVESLILSHNSKIDEIKKELNQYKEMVDSILDGSPEYQQKNEVAKAAAKEKNLIKKQLLGTAEAVKLLVKVKEYRDQIKDLKEALSDYLKQYQQLSGSNQIETPDGVLRQIVYTAKLVVKQEDFKK